MANYSLSYRPALLCAYSVFFKAMQSLCSSLRFYATHCLCTSERCLQCRRYAFHPFAIAGPINATLCLCISLQSLRLSAFAARTKLFHRIPCFAYAVFALPYFAFAGRGCHRIAFANRGCAFQGRCHAFSCLTLPPQFCAALCCAFASLRPSKQCHFSS